MSRNSSYKRLSGCPVCHNNEVRETTPLVPDVEAYKCERCGHKWEEQ